MLRTEKGENYEETGSDQFETEGVRLAGELEKMLYLEGISVKLDCTFKGETIGSAVYDKSGELKDKRFLYGR
jgi:hypothetical protein